MGISARTTQLVSDLPSTGLVGVSRYHALKFTFSPTNEFWMASGPIAEAKLKALYPAADVRKAHISQLPSLVEDGGIISDAVSTDSGSYIIADIDQDASNAIAERFANDQAVKGSVVTQYTCDDDTTFTEDRRVRTNICEKYIDDEGAVTITFNSVRSLLKKKIWRRREWRLSATLNPGDDFLPIIPPNNEDPATYTMPTFEHTELYAFDPGLTIGYLRLSNDEIVSYTNPTLITNADGVYGVALYKRELFGSVSEQIEVDNDTEDDNKPVIKSFIVLDEMVVNHAKLIVEGQTIDGRVPPIEWTEDLGDGYINERSIALLTMGDPAHRLRYLDPPEQTSIDFLSKHLAKDIPALMLTDTQGQFEFIKRTPIRSGSSVAATLRSGLNLVEDQAFRLDHITDRLANPMIAKRAWEPVQQRYAISDNLVFGDTLSKYGPLEPVTYEYLGYDSTIGSPSGLYARQAFLMDSHSDEGKVISVLASPEMDYLRVGELVLLQLPEGSVLDASTGNFIAEPIDEEFIIAVKNTDAEHVDAVEFVLFTTQGEAQRREDSRLEFHIDQAELSRLAPMNLDAITAPSIVGSQATYTGRHVVLGNRLYRIDHLNAVLGADFELVPAAPCQYLGIAFADRLRVDSTVGAINTTAQGAFRGVSAPGGTPGFIGRPVAGGALDVSLTRTGAVGSSWLAIENSHVSPAPAGAVQQVYTGLPLTNIDGRVGGIPRTLAGSGGGPAGPVDIKRNDNGAITDTTSVAQRGGDGGAGAILLGPKPSRSANGVYADVSGGPGDATVLAGNNYHTAPPAGGAPGTFSLIITGNNPNVAPLSGDSVYAFTGQSPSAATKLPSSNETRFRVSDDAPVTSRSAFSAPEPARNLWAAHSAISHVPAPATLQERPLSAFEALANNDIDGRQKLLLIHDGPPATFPGNADINDYAASQSDLRNLQLTPRQVPIWQLTSNGWRQVDFINGEDAIAEFRIVQYRARGTFVLHLGPPRPVTGEYEVGDSYFDKDARTLVYLGATAAQDTRVNRDAFGDHTGLDFQVDPTTAEYISGSDTWVFSNSYDTPLVVPGTASSGTNDPGQTTDQFIILPTVPREYVDNGAAQWVINGANLESQNSGGSGDARAYFGATQGFFADNNPRKAWIYAKGNGVVKIQGAGTTSGAGDAGLQVQATVNSIDFVWVQMTGQFPAFAAQAQLRTQAAGITVASMLFITEASVSVPDGPGGFVSGDTVSTSLRPPYWPPVQAVDRLLPLAQGTSRGPIQVGMFGVRGTPGLRIDYAGIGVPSVAWERFPHKATAGSQYLASCVVRNVTSSMGTKGGVLMRFEGYNAFGVRLFASDNNIDTADWFRGTGAEFKKITSLFKLPQLKDASIANNVVWVAVKLVVEGDASGYAEASELRMIELPYRVYQLRGTDFTYSGVFKDPVDQTRTVDVFDVDGKAGMRVDVSAFYRARVDSIDPLNAVNNLERYPEMSIVVWLEYYDENDQAVSITRENPPGVFNTYTGELLAVYAHATFDNPERVVALRHSFGPWVSTDQEPMPQPVLGETYQTVNESDFVVAKHDFYRIWITAICNDETQAAPTNDLNLTDLDITITYGEHFDLT